jgi:hypothetical protein
MPGARQPARRFCRERSGTGRRSLAAHPAEVSGSVAAAPRRAEVRSGLVAAAEGCLEAQAFLAAEQRAPKLRGGLRRTSTPSPNRHTATVLRFHQFRNASLRNITRHACRHGPQRRRLADLFRQRQKCSGLERTEEARCDRGSPSAPLLSSPNRSADQVFSPKLPGIQFAQPVPRGAWRGKERRRVGGKLATPLPTRAWPGRTKDAKPLDPAPQPSKRSQPRTTAPALSRYWLHASTAHLAGWGGRRGATERPTGGLKRKASFPRFSTGRCEETLDRAPLRRFAD